MIDKICSCGHLESNHNGLDETIEQRLDKLVKTHILTPQYHPDRLRPTGYIFAAEKNGRVYYSYEAVEEVIINLRVNYSSCKDKVFFSGCGCERFQADNLRYLEVYCERKASQIIH